MPIKPELIHPGEILLEEFLQPMGISQHRLAKGASVSARRINAIVHGKRAITADAALRLSRYFGMTEQFRMNLQTRYDLEVEKAVLARVSRVRCNRCEPQGNGGKLSNNTRDPTAVFGVRRSA